MINNIRVFKNIRNIFFVIIAGLALSFFAAVLMVKHIGPVVVFTPAQLQYFETVVILLALIGIPAGHYIQKKKTDNMAEDLPEESKLLRYKTGYFIKLSILQSLGILSLLGYILSENGSFLAIFGILFVVVIINYPAKDVVSDCIRPKEENEITE